RPGCAARGRSPRGRRRVLRPEGAREDERLQAPGQDHCGGRSRYGADRALVRPGDSARQRTRDGGRSALGRGGGLPRIDVATDTVLSYTCRMKLLGLLLGLFLATPAHAQLAAAVPPLAPHSPLNPPPTPFPPTTPPPTA